MKRFLTFFVAVFLISFSSIAQSEDARSEIIETAEMMQQAMQDGDFNQFGTYFTEDVMFKMSGRQPLSGRAAVTEAHKPMAEQKMKLIINTEEVKDFGEYAHEIGNYEIHTKDGQMVDAGHYSTLWKKVNGEWKIYRDIISSSGAMK